MMDPWCGLELIKVVLTGSESLAIKFRSTANILSVVLAEVHVWLYYVLMNQIVHFEDLLTLRRGKRCTAKYI